MKKRFTYDCAVKILGILFALLYMSIYFWGIQYLYSSDTCSSDIVVHEVRTNGLGSLRDFVAQQTFQQFDLLYWLPNFLILSLVHNVILADRLTSLLYWVAILLLSWSASRILTNKKSAWITLLILGCGVSIEFLSNMSDLLIKRHLIYMLILLCLAGASLKIDRMSKKKKVLFSISSLLYLIYIIAIDQRYAAIYAVPLFASILISYYFDVREAESIVGAFKQPKKKLYILCGLAVGSILGLCINYYLKNSFPFSSRLTDLNSSMWGFADLTHFFDTLMLYILGILKLWGCEFSQGVSTVSIQSIFYIIKGCVCVICMVIIPILCVVRYKTLPEGMKVLVGMYFVLSAELFYIYELSSLNELFISRYFVYEMPLCIMISAWYFQEKIMNIPNLDRLVFVLGAMAFCVISVITTFDAFRDNKNAGVFQEKMDLIEAIEDEGVSYGYASYWNAEILTTLSNNEITAKPVYFINDIYPFYDLNFIHSFSADNHVGKTFLILDGTEQQDLLDNTPEVLTQLGEPINILTSGRYYVYIYDHNIAEDLYYFPYNDGYIPRDGAYDEAEVVFSEDAFDFDSVGSVNILSFPVTIEPDSYYKLSFTADTDMLPTQFYADFLNEDQGVEGQVAPVVFSEGKNDYYVLMHSGEQFDSSEADITLQVIGIPTDTISVSDLLLTKLDLPCRNEIDE